MRCSVKEEIVLAPEAQQLSGALRHTARPPQQSPGYYRIAAVCREKRCLRRLQTRLPKESFLSYLYHCEGVPCGAVGFVPGVPKGEISVLGMLCSTTEEAETSCAKFIEAGLRIAERLK